MKISAALLAAAAVIGVTNATAAGNIKPLIVGGTIVPAGTKTYQVSLRDTADGFRFCGGSLITPTHVLTAGHWAGAEWVSVGTHFFIGTADGERNAVKMETVHPQFNRSTLTHDYSILELVSPSIFPPVKLLNADSEAFVGSFATATGWGTTTRDGEPSNELLRVDVPIVATPECSKLEFPKTESQ
jgi:trypsin